MIIALSLKTNIPSLNSLLEDDTSKLPSYSVSKKIELKQFIVQSLERKILKLAFEFSRQ